MSLDRSLGLRPGCRVQAVLPVSVHAFPQLGDLLFGEVLEPALFREELPHRLETAPSDPRTDLLLFVLQQGLEVGERPEREA